MRKSIIRGAVLASAAALLNVAAPSHAAPLATCTVHNAVAAAGGFNVRATGTAANVGTWDYEAAGANVPGLPIQRSIGQTSATFDRTIFVPTAGAIYTHVDFNLVFGGFGPDYACRAGLNVASTPVGLVSLPG